MRARRSAARADTPSREELNERRVVAPDLPREADHLYRCAGCGQWVDRRELGDVLHHEEPGHTPLAAPAVRFVEPMAPSLASGPPDGDEWQHEIKYDGYRTQLLVAAGAARAITRNGHDWTARYGSIVAAAAALRCTSAILDGEVIVQDEQGRPHFHGLRGAISRRPCDLVFVAFDLLHINGRDIRRDPLEERRERLRELVDGAGPGCLQFSEHTVGGGAEFLAAVDRMGLEGIVSKRRRSRYRSGASRSWLKVKCFAEDEFVLLGTAHTAGRPPMALLARHGQAGLEYAGAAIVALGGAERERFWAEVERLTVERPAAPAADQAGARWVRPELLVRARFLKGEEMLRHATIAAVSRR